MTAAEHLLALLSEGFYEAQNGSEYLCVDHVKRVLKTANTDLAYDASCIATGRRLRGEQPERNQTLAMILDDFSSDEEP